MTTTPRLGITQLEEDQALPEVVVNEGVLKLEGYATRAILKSKGDNTPPGSPADGDMYLIGGTGTGVWTGHDNQLAQYVNGAWDFDTPKEGFEIEVEDEDTAYVLRGGSWVSSGSGAVTTSGLTMSTARLLGRTTASTGAIEEITVGSGLSLTAGALTATGGGATIDIEDEGVAEASASTLNFTGAGVTATDQGAGVVDIDIPGGGGSVAWALAGTGQTATGVYDFAVDGAKANIDFAGLASFNELILVARGVSYGSSVSRLVQVSVDNGSTWFTTSGDYVTVDNAGVETAATGITLHNTATGSARTVVLQIKNTRGAQKLAQRQATDANVLFVGSASDINAVRFANSGAANTTAGTVRLYAR